MKKFFALTALFALVLTISIHSQPKLTINLTGGYNVPLPDFKGDVTDSADRVNTYTIKNGFNFGLAGKYAFDKRGMFRITFGGSYNMFKGEGDYVHINNVHIHNKINAITVGLGAEYAFMPKGKTNPFIGLDLNGNFFSGEYEEEVTSASTTDHNDIGTTTTKLKSASRFGVSVGGGVDFAFSKNIGAVIGVKYHLANLVGKAYDSVAAVGEYNLNDKEFTLNNKTYSSKNISFIQLYAGVSFYFLQPKKSVKK